MDKQDRLMILAAILIKDSGNIRKAVESALEIVEFVSTHEPEQVESELEQLRALPIALVQGEK